MIKKQIHQCWNSFVGFLESRDKFVAGISTIFLVAFTALLAGSTLFLYRATRSLVQGAEKTAEQQMRAYIYVKEANMVSQGDNQFWQAKIVFKNFGQTPAYGVVTPTDFYKSVKSSKYDFEEPPADLITPTNDWGPGQEVIVLSKSDKALTPEEAAHFRNGSWVIFIHGIVKYRDAFGNNRFTKFRMQYRPDGLLDAHGDGNTSN
jgi:hypothetical protein